MDSIEEAFGQAEEAAGAALKAASTVVSRARAMAKAARTGHIAGIRKAQADLARELEALGREVEGAVGAWPLTDEGERDYLADGYAKELRAAATDAGVTTFERDGYLVAWPSLVRVLPGDRAVRVDRKRVPTIRPTYLAALLLARQGKSSGFPPARFLETLSAVYEELLREERRQLHGGPGPVIPLARIYRLVTALPGAARDYDRSDFARDIYTLDLEGPRHTRRGRTVSFPASTGTRRRSTDLFAFIGPNGESHEYYGIKFSDPD